MAPPAFKSRLIPVSKKALSKLIKESRPRAGGWRCCTIARRRDETSMNTSVSPQPVVIPTPKQPAVRPRPQPPTRQGSSSQCDVESTTPVTHPSRSPRPIPLAPSSYPRPTPSRQHKRAITTAPIHGIMLPQPQQKHTVRPLSSRQNSEPRCCLVHFGSPPHRHRQRQPDMCLIRPE